MARSRGFRQVQVPRRKTDWGLGPANEAGTTITGSGSSLGSSAISPTVPGLTLVRTRGHALWYLNQASAANNGFHGAMGIGIATLAAVTAGAASVPTPITEADWDGWIWHQFFQCRSGGIIDGSVSADHDLVNSTSAAVRFEIDSKAMRKFSDDDMAIFAALEVTEVGTAAMVWSFDSRMLFKLS